MVVMQSTLKRSILSSNNIPIERLHRCQATPGHGPSWTQGHVGVV